MTSPRDWARVKASLFSFVLGLLCNETRRRRRAERLSRLPMRVVRGPAPRLWQGPLLKAVNTRPLTFREWIRVGQSASPYWSQVGWSVHAPQTKKVDVFKRARSKISAVQKSGDFPSTSTTTTTSLLINHFSRPWCLSASVRQGDRGFNDISIRRATVRLLSFHPFISPATGRACPFHDESNLRLIPHDGRLACCAISCG